MTNTESAARQLRTLMNEGYSEAVIAHAVNTSSSTVGALASGEFQRTQRSLARRILTVTRAEILHRAPDEFVVARLGASRRLHALSRMGWALSNLADGDKPTLRLLQAVSQERSLSILGKSHRTIRGLYEAHSMTPGPSVGAFRWARSRDWAPPLAWDDETIDDPAATPDFGAPPDTNAERRHLYDQGMSDQQIGAILGTTSSAIRLWRTRNGNLPANYQPGGKRTA